MGVMTRQDGGGKGTLVKIQENNNFCLDGKPKPKKETRYVREKIKENNESGQRTAKTTGNKNSLFPRKGAK